jgi:hypothetical protein
MAQPAAFLRDQLAALLNVRAESMPRIRVTPDDRKLPALSDITQIITGLNARNSVDAMRRLFEKYPAIFANCEHFHFSGQGQRPTYIPKSLAVLIEFIMLLPGQKAAALRTEVARIFVRYLGGDLGLIDEVRELRRVQEHLAEIDPTDWRRTFGETIECSNSSVSRDITRAHIPERSVENLDGVTSGSAKKARLENTTAVVKMRDVLCRHMGTRRRDGGIVTPEREMKRLLRLASSTFLDLVAREYPDLSDASIKRRYAPDAFGQKTAVPRADMHLAEAAVMQVLEETSKEAPWVAPDIEERAPATPADRNSSRPKRAFAVHDDEHAAAKDRANALWISFLLLADRACAGSETTSKVFYLDDFKEAQGGLQLRTTEALLRAGFCGGQLFSANTSEAVVSALRRRGVQAFHGAWDDRCWDRERFAGIYLDLCAGSAGYAIQQLELASHRSEPGCVLAWTITERDYEGEDLLLRHNQLADLLTERGWRPACGRHLRPSTLLHRSSGGSRQRVLTQFWRKGG